MADTQNDRNSHEVQEVSDAGPSCLEVSPDLIHIEDGENTSFASE